ncbi:hypothetical protein HDU85_003875 [Gaertneriomyces sp. JEL0708]|nr:hypothetical protein HDU85_003875 [Gaertneriomyces sp. JEL0708]
MAATTTTTTTTTTGTPQTVAMYKKAAIQQDFERILQSGAPTTRITLSSRWDSNDPSDLDDVDIYYPSNSTSPTTNTATPTSTPLQDGVSVDHRTSVGTHITTNSSNSTAYSLQPPTSPTATGSKLVGFLKNNMGAPVNGNGDINTEQNTAKQPSEKKKRKRFFGFGRSKSIVPSSPAASLSISAAVTPPPILNTDNNNTNTTDPLHVHFSDIQKMSFPDDASRNKAVRQSIIIAEDQGRLVLPRLQSLHSHQNQSSSPGSSMNTEANTTQDPAPLLKMPDESFRVSLFDPKVLGLSSLLHSPDDSSVGDAASQTETGSVAFDSPPPPPAITQDRNGLVMHSLMERYGKNENTSSPPVDDVALPFSVPYYTQSPPIEPPPHQREDEVSPDNLVSPYQYDDDDGEAYTDNAQQQQQQREGENENDEDEDDDYLLDMDDETLHNTELNTLVPVVPVSYNGLVIQPVPRIKLNRNRNRNPNVKVGGNGRGRVLRFDERTELCRGAWIDDEGEVWAYPETDVQWGTLNGETEDWEGGAALAVVGEGEFDRGWVRERTSSLRRDDGMTNTNGGVGADVNGGGAGETLQPQIVVGQVQRSELAPPPVGRVHRDPVPPVSSSDPTTTRDVTPPPQQQPPPPSSSSVSVAKPGKDTPQDISHPKPLPPITASDEKPPEKQRRKKIRHVQIQTRPLLVSTSSQTSPMMSDTKPTTANTDVSDVDQLTREIEQLKATVAAQQKKFDTLSKQAYQKVKQLLVERETLVGELEVVRGVVRSA